MIVMLARDTDRDLTMIVPELPDRGVSASRVRQRKIIHIDMDAFFASVEQRDNPELRGKPVAVGGSRERGVVAAASYEARTFGVRSAMPSVTAKRRCPDLIFVKPRFDLYKSVSLQIREIFAEYTPIIELGQVQAGQNQRGRQRDRVAVLHDSSQWKYRFVAAFGKHWVLHVRAAQVGVSQVAFSQVGAIQEGVAQVGADQVGAAQAYGDQDGEPQVGVAQA